MSRDILCVKREELFKDKTFQGFCPIKENDFIPTILEKLEYQDRTDELENNKEFQQIIPYVWIINPKTKKVFIYKRAKTGNEGRLYNKFSGGVGGHIDRDTEEHTKDPIAAAMMREMKEEVIMENYPSPKFIGFINDDSEEVGKVHFGVVALAETTEDIKPAEDMAHGEFLLVDEIEKTFSNPENTIESWTQISWPFIKDYVKSRPE
ncbi:MAG: NUDIX domain-containing protein [archaeon]